MKFSLSLFVFVPTLLAGVFFKDAPDVSGIGLGVASIILAYWVARTIKTKPCRIALMTIFGIILMQWSVTGQAMAWHGIPEVVSQKGIAGMMLADAIYGFKYIPLTLVDSCHGVYMGLRYDDFAFVEKMNPRFVVVAWLIVLNSLILGFSKKLQEKHDKSRTQNA